MTQSKKYPWIVVALLMGGCFIELYGQANAEHHEAFDANRYS